MRMRIAQIAMIGLVLSAAQFSRRDSLGADTAAEPNAKPERLSGINVALSALTGIASCSIHGMARALRVAAEAQKL